MYLYHYSIGANRWVFHQNIPEYSGGNLYFDNWFAGDSNMAEAIPVVPDSPFSITSNPRYRFFSSSIQPGILEHDCMVHEEYDGPSIYLTGVSLEDVNKIDLIADGTQNILCGRIVARDQGGGSYILYYKLKAF